MAWYWPSSFTASIAFCTMATALFATSSVIWLRSSPKAAAAGVEDSLVVMRWQNKKSALGGALSRTFRFSLSLIPE
jgi:hypothetical protein